MSSIVFSTRPTRAWDPETNRRATVSRRHDHVHVLALLHHLDQANVDPMCLDQWEFHVVPTNVLDSRTRSPHSITLAALRRGFAADPVSYRQLRATVLRAADFEGNPTLGEPNH